MTARHDLRDGPWLNEPRRWSRADNGDLVVSTDRGTDFWRHTHYGFVRDSGHFLGTAVAGEFVATVDVDGRYREQYDQAGLMVRLDAERWVKCGIEYVDGTQQMSTVVTHGVSDWSVSPLAPAPSTLSLRLTRRGDSLTVEYGVDGGAHRLHRVAYLPPDLPASVGPMAATPDGSGFDVTFRNWSVVDI